VIRVGNAPCSWGILEFEGAAPDTSPMRMLEEMSAAGYAGTELGDWGFLPTDPAALSLAVSQHGLNLIGAFVPVRLADPAALDAGIATAVRAATLLAAAEGEDAFVVLSDDNATVALRTTRAGRVGPADGLRPDQWDGFSARAQHIAEIVRDATGLRTVFHHHCAGYVETPGEIDALMTRTDPKVLGLCLDTGHITYGGGDAVTALTRHGDRVWHVHAKDCEPNVARRAREAGWDYHTALRHGIFCELGHGAVDFRAVVDELNRRSYSGWIVVEQDVLAGMGTPAASAERNRRYLQQLGL
jgi:inosose dehydratase